MSRLNELLQQAGNIGRNEDGSITRLGFSEKYFQALEFLKGRMQELGMQVEIDPVGNLHGVLQGSDPEAKSIVIDSHMDTVMQGGVYDGMLDVTGAKYSTPCDPRLIKLIDDVCTEKGISHIIMPSGAGHDANAMAHEGRSSDRYDLCSECQGHQPSGRRIYKTGTYRFEGRCSVSDCVKTG